MAKVTIFGAGYVGVPSGAHFARTHKVTVYDPDKKKIDAINKVTSRQSEELHIHEGGLIELMQENHSNLKATTNIEEALDSPEIIFIAVGTPPNEKGRANLKYVCSAAEMIAKHVKNDVIVLNKSTVPPGTAYLVKEIIEKNLVNKVKISVGSCPEFLAEGTAIEDLRTPDRIVYGCDDPAALEKVTDFFLYLHGKSTLCPMSTVSSEITKYAANALLATKISFMNSLALLCDEIGGNIREVQDGVGRDTRVGRKFLNASMGYGGSCFPKDTSAIAEYGKMMNSRLEIIESTIAINDKTTEYFGDKLIQDFNGDVAGKNVAIWGIGFKARTDDLRDSKPVQLARQLMDGGAHVHIYDTVKAAQTNFAAENDEKYLGKYTMYTELYDMISSETDGLVIGNEHEIFRNPDRERLDVMRSKNIYDGKNILNRRLITDLKEHGYHYRSVGKDILANELDEQRLITFLREKYMD